jgi:hypothetical protein
VYSVMTSFYYRFGRNEVSCFVNRLLSLKRWPTAREMVKFVGTVVSMSRSAARLCASFPRWDAYVKLMSSWLI